MEAVSGSRCVIKQKVRFNERGIIVLLCNDQPARTRSMDTTGYILEHKNILLRSALGN